MRAATHQAAHPAAAATFVGEANNADFRAGTIDQHRSATSVETRGAVAVHRALHPLPGESVQVVNERGHVVNVPRLDGLQIHQHKSTCS